MKLSKYIFILLLLSTCSPQVEQDLNFMLGTWKHESKDQFEAWEKVSELELSGEGYKIIDGKKQLWETLSIQKIDGQWVFQARVPDQNEGEVVSFILNPNSKATLSFENEAHDFPKKIQYRPISEDSIQVHVVGKNGEGFSFVQVRQ